VQVNYKLDKSSGSFSDNFKANYWRSIRNTTLELPM
jgi:hypothetical protein